MVCQILNEYYGKLSWISRRVNMLAKTTAHGCMWGSEKICMDITMDVANDHTQEDVKAASEELMKLGFRARLFLAECVEEQIVTRKKISKAANSLHDAGFIFIRDSGTQWELEWTITPSLLGEEALEFLERQEEYLLGLKSAKV